jgi:hypothetical protein
MTQSPYGEVMNPQSFRTHNLAICHFYIVYLSFIEYNITEENPISSLHSKPDSAANSSQPPLISGLCMATVTDDECSTNNSAAVGLGFSALPIL